MLLRRDYQAIAAAVAGREYPQTASPIAEQLILSLVAYRAVGGDSQEWLQNLRMVLGDNFISNIFRENPKETDTPIDAGRVSEYWYIVPAEDMDKLPDMEWIIPGEIPERGLTMLYSLPGVGKSFFALNYALRIAQESPVVYVAGEGEYGLRKRMEAWCKHHRKGKGKLFVTVGAVHVLDDSEFELFLGQLKSICPRFIVFDTLARAMLGYDENSTRDMGLFVNRTDRIKNELDCSILLIHHTNKAGLVERGSIALRGACDQIIKLWAEDDTVRWEVQKTKEDEEAPSGTFKKVSVTVEKKGKTLQSIVFVEAEKVISTVENLSKSQKRILECLSLKIFESGAETLDILGETSLARSTAFTALSTLIELKLIEKVGHGSYKLTVEGSKVQKSRSPEVQKDDLDETSENDGTLGL
jgi:hypothetical protein